MAGAGPSRPPDWKATSSPAPTTKFGRNSFLALHNIWENIDAVQTDKPTTDESDRAINRPKFGSAETAALTQVWANLNSDIVNPLYKVNFSDREIVVNRFGDDTRRVALIPRPRILRRGVSEIKSALPVPSLPAGTVTVPGVEDSEEVLSGVRKTLSTVLFADHVKRPSSAPLKLVKLPPPPAEPPLAQLVQRAPVMDPGSDDESPSSVFFAAPAEEPTFDLTQIRQIFDEMSEKQTGNARAEPNIARNSSYCKSVSGILDSDIAPSMILDDQKPSNLEEIFPSLV